MVNYQRTVMEAWQKMLEKEGGERGLFCCGLASYSILKHLPTCLHVFSFPHPVKSSVSRIHERVTRFKM